MTTRKARKAAAAVPAQLRESAQQFLSVGRDAINKAQQEGNRVFEALVKEANPIRSLHKKTRDAAEASVSEMTARATDTWDKLEQVFETRVARALRSLGVPTRRELDELSARVDALAKAVEKLVKTAAKPAAAVKARAVKPATAKRGAK
jgi:poly(hydroxyalkanoate) granule-associated protein